MAHKLWLKLWHKILDDSKMARLPDDLWRRSIEFFVLAGEKDSDGELPNLDEICWRLRIPETVVQTQMDQLESVGILKKDSGVWRVVNYSHYQQKPMTGAERVRIWRECNERGNETLQETLPRGEEKRGEENINGYKPKRAKTRSLSYSAEYDKIKEHFIAVSGIGEDKTNYTTWKKQWYDPINALLGIAKNDTDLLAGLIEDAIKKLRDGKCTIKAPISLVATVKDKMVGYKRYIPTSEIKEIS